MGAAIVAYQDARSAECEIVGPSYGEFLDCVTNSRPVRPKVALPPRSSRAGGGLRLGKEMHAMPTVGIDEPALAFIAGALREAADAYERRAEEHEVDGQEDIAGERRRQAQEARRLADRIESR